MKRNITISVLIVAFATVISCSGSCPNGSDDKGTAAIVNGQVITMGDLNRAAKDVLAKVDTQIYQIKKKVLDSLVEERIIAGAAKAKGVNVDEFMAQEIDAKVTPPTDDEVKALYDARKGAMN